MRVLLLLFLFFAFIIFCVLASHLWADHCLFAGWLCEMDRVFRNKVHDDLLDCMKREMTNGEMIMWMMMMYIHCCSRKVVIHKSASKPSKKTIKNLCPSLYFICVVRKLMVLWRIIRRRSFHFSLNYPTCRHYLLDIHPPKLNQPSPLLSSSLPLLYTSLNYNQWNGNNYCLFVRTRKFFFLFVFPIMAQFHLLILILLVSFLYCRKKLPENQQPPPTTIRLCTCDQPECDFLTAAARSWLVVTLCAKPIVSSSASDVIYTTLESNSTILIYHCDLCVLSHVCLFKKVKQTKRCKEYKEGVVEIEDEKCAMKNRRCKC